MMYTNLLQGCTLYNSPTHAVSINYVGRTDLRASNSQREKYYLGHYAAPCSAQFRAAYLLANYLTVRNLRCW